MPQFRHLLALGFLLVIGGSLPLQAATPPALSAPSATPESPLGPESYGALAGQASVSAGGNASYVLPIELPPGTRGMVPQVSLNYNSNMRNGLLGLGWFLQGPTSRITRCPQTVSQDGISHTVDYSTDDRFCLDGHRLVVESGTYGSSGTEYRTETDSFSRVISHGIAGTGPAYFTVETKDGLTRYYGNTTDSQIEAQGMTTVATWALNRVEDAAGNYYAINYFEDNAEGAFYPTEMVYTGNDTAGLSPNVEVEFLYEDRPDTRPRFEGGARITDHPKRLVNIRTYVDLALVSDYRLNYELVGVDENPYSPGVGRFSRLTQIERCDALDAYANCQDPIILDWWAQGDGAAFNYYELDVPADTVTQHYPTSYSSKPRWHDVNGDGTADYVLPSKYSDGTYEVLLSGPGGYTTETWSGGYVGYPTETYWADINGDGRVDIIYQKNSGSNSTFHVSLSTGSGFTTQTWKTHAKSYSTVDFYFRDMNGDKLLDLLVQECQSCAFSTQLMPGTSLTTTEDNKVFVYPNTGTGFGAKETWADTTNEYVDLADMNGDGLTDIVTGGEWVQLNDGTGFVAPAVSWPTSGTTGSSYITYQDYNGDGKADRLWHNTNEVYYNTGGSFVLAGYTLYPPYADFNGDGRADTFTRTIDTGPGSYGYGDADITLRLLRDDLGTSYDSIVLVNNSDELNLFHQVVDVNGDGISEYTASKTWDCDPNSGYPDYRNGKWCETGKIRIYRSTETHLHLLKTITSGQGATFTFFYSPLTDHSIYTKYNTSTLPELDVQDGTQVVTKTRQTEAMVIGGSYDINYKYEGLKRDLDGHGNLGFARIIADSQRDKTTTITDYAQTFPYSSRPIRTEVRRHSDGQLLSSTDTTYGLHGVVGAGTVFPYVDTRATNNYDLGDGRLLSTVTVTNQVDTYGNITNNTETTLDHETGDFFKKATVSSYTIDEGNWRIGQLTIQKIKGWLNGVHYDSQDVRTNFFYYPSTGFLQKTTRAPGKGTGFVLHRTLSYDSFGNVVSEVLSGPGITSRSSVIAYDSRGQFPVTLTNPLGHQMSRSWDPALGTKLTETDANGQTTSWAYNSFGQQIMEYRPDGTTTETRLYEDNSGIHPAAVLYMQTLTTGKAPVREFYDLFGRTVRVRTQGFDGSYLNQDTEYYWPGLVKRTSEPYYDGDSIEWNTNTHDDLGRVTSVVAADPVKSVTSSYDGFTVAVTDAQSRTKTQTTNAVGQIIAVVDEMGTRMEMTYDSVGNRIQVTNAVGTAKENSVTYTYDLLGRLLTQNDPDHGIYTYTYDSYDQKISEVSPKLAAAGQSITYQYDLLGRMTSRTEPEGTTTWTFDNTASGNLGIGQLHSESATGFSRTYRYAAGNHGRLTGTTTQIASTTYNTAMTYNSNGQIATETYPASTSSPGGFQVEYTYNALGFQERVQAPGGGTVYYQLLDADASGRTTGEWLGDGSIASQAYESASSRVVDQHTTNGGTDIQHFSYSYDDAGNMTSRGDVRLGLSETFSFDDLDRLTSAQVSGQTAATYGFDVVGNITEKSDIGNPYLYTSSAVHAVTEITVGAITRNLSYDPNGNLSNGDDVPTITWSSYNKPTQLTKGSITYTFAYGPDRSRYKKTHSNGTTTYYIGGGFERINKPTSTEFRHVIRANGKAVMLRKDYSLGGVSHEYIHRDHLGSITALTRESDGSVIERYSYDAWGQRRDPTTWAAAAITAYEQRGYTGHEHLDDIGIIHMNGRIYEPRLGRMLSPDPVTQAPENGQNYNRYSYAYNNPLKYSDPSGFYVEPTTAAATYTVGQFVADTLINSAFAFVADKVFGELFGGNGCDRTCKDRQAAHNWCKAQSACLAELRANTREKFRRRSTQVILEATQTGQSYYYENGRAYLGDNTTGTGDPVAEAPPVGGIGYQGFNSFQNAFIRGLNALLRISGNEKTLVIGENMADRVIPYAKANGAEWFVPSEGLSYEEALEENTKFIIEKMDQGYTIIDIGPQPGRANYPLPTSDFYLTEVIHVYGRNGALPYENLVIDRQP